MRIRLFLVGTLVGSVALGLAVQACGSSADTDAGTENEAGVDAGTAASEASTIDSGAKDSGSGDGGPPCDKSTDFLAGIQDASFADGATTTGICLSCAKTKCKTQVDACGNSCACRTTGADVLDCYLTTQDINTCGFKLVVAPAEARTLGQDLFTCLGDECTTECAANEL